MRILASCLLGFTIWAAPAHAVIWSGFGTNVVFTGTTAQASATWSESLSQGVRGLSFPSNRLDSAWIQTFPIPVGLAWRPPTEADVAVAIEGAFTDAFVKEDRSMYAYIRYGCDRRNWSTWIPMAHTTGALHSESTLAQLHRDDDRRQKTFSATLRIPSEVGKSYWEGMDAWRKTDPAWADDQDAYSRWLLSRNPAFFERTFPFLGYIQIRFENPSGFHGVTNIKSIRIRGSWVVGGLHSPPKGGAYPESDESAWRLDLEDLGQNQSDKRKPNTPSHGASLPRRP